jgi:hypothetical protein
MIYATVITCLILDISNMKRPDYLWYTPFLSSMPVRLPPAHASERY